MLPAWAIGSLIGAGLGALKGKANEKKMEEQDKFRKAAIQNSPWTGMSDPGALNLPGMTGSLMSGAALGGLTGGMMGGAAPVAEGAASAAAPTAVNTATGANVLGGGAMANSMAMTPAIAGASPGAWGAMATPAAGGSGMNDFMKWQLMSQLSSQGM